MTNFWLERASAIVEREVVIVKNALETKSWYDKMPNILSIFYPIKKQPTSPLEFEPKVGIANHLRYTKYGIEAVLKMPRKYHRLNYYVLYDNINRPIDPFCVILYANN